MVVGEPESEERLVSSLLWLSEVPQIVYTAPCRVPDAADVPALVRWRMARREPVPFITRGNMIFAFHDLRGVDGLFSEVAEPRQADLHDCAGSEVPEEVSACQLELIDRALSARLRLSGLRYDHRYARHYVAVPEQARRAALIDGIGPLVRRIDGATRSYWRHEAVAVRVLCFPGDQVGITIRPELYLTLDGRVPARDRFAARWVTEEKTSMGNNAYRHRVEFWRDVLTQGKERCDIRIGSQHLVIEGGLLGCAVSK